MSACPVFSIITPSFNSSRWLKLCIESVADQNVPLEHIIQDPGSKDGTLDWAPRDPRVLFQLEADRGMYDAINRGLSKARGEILAYLNCDEQYLPGALAAVREYFEENPRVEVVFGDALIVNAEGDLIAYRKSILPNKLHTHLGNSLAILTCATFFRRSVVERGLLFNPELRSVGDAEWLLRLLRAKVTMGLLHRYTSTFAITGENVSANPKYFAEQARFRAEAPAAARLCRRLINAQHHLRKALSGAYREKGISYRIYTPASGGERVTFQRSKPSFRWQG